MRRIETQRMVIRDFKMDDVQDLFEILGDDETMKYCEPAYDICKTEEFLRDFCIGRRGAMAAELKESGKMVGYILFKEYEMDVYEAGWIFNREYWRRGLAYESMAAVFSYGFESLNANKIFAETVDLEKSVRLMKKLGMKFEGIQEDQTDLHVYGLMAEEWLKLNKEI